MPPPTFQLRAGPLEFDQLQVTAFEGVETLSRPYQFHVDFFPADGEQIEPADLLDQEGQLEIALPDGSLRTIHGVIPSIESLGEHGGRLRYRAHLVPAVARLAHVRRSQIFQEKSAKEIVTAMLDKAGIAHRWSLNKAPAAREYCVQYRESDLDFISRLLEWEGIFFFFEQEDGAHTLVLADAPTAFQAIPGGPEALLFRAGDSGRVAESELVIALEDVRRLRTSAVTVRDFDPLHPGVDLTQKLKASGKAPVPLEVYEYPAEYVKAPVGKHAGEAHLDERRLAARTLDGESHSPRIAPGFAFQVEEHPDASFNGRYLTLEVAHHGTRREVQGQAEALEQAYRNSFRVVPNGTPVRSKVRTPRPAIHGVQTATVSGPGGEEIHTDEHGRVKVQFHWDRGGFNDEKSSCWVRVGQGWGGPGWGALFLPRIGQEVIVRFLEGNPDRPVITGAVYNGGNPTPYGLPGEKTKSTTMSNSSPGGSGSNELRFEDAAAEEEIYLHAQKDKTIAVENNKDQTVGRDETLEVTKDRTRTINGMQKLQVIKDDTSTITGNQSLTVDKNRSTVIHGDEAETVTGNQAITISKTQNIGVKIGVDEFVGAAKALTIGAANFVNVVFAHDTSVGAARAETVGGARSEYIKGNRDENIDGDRSAKVIGADRQEVTGGVISAVKVDLKEDITGKSQLKITKELGEMAKEFKLKADKFSIIVNGKLAVSMEKSGKIKVFANKLTIEGD